MTAPSNRYEQRNHERMHNGIRASGDLVHMDQQHLSRKKIVEELYLKEAIKASTVFPSGKLIPSEEPDFILQHDNKVIGIEVTELCEEAARAEGGRLRKIASKAHDRYSRVPHAVSVDVSAAFAPNVRQVRSQKLVKGLTDFVVSHQGQESSFNWNSYALPEGYCHIGIFKPFEPAGRWWVAAGSITNAAPKELIDACIEAKNELLEKYRAKASEVWLLIVNDNFLGAGEVHARVDLVTAWEFDFSFDKVLLFSRQPGGTGEVIELRRSFHA